MANKCTIFWNTIDMWFFYDSIHFWQTECLENTVVQKRLTFPTTQMKQDIQHLEIICKTYWLSSRKNLSLVVVASGSIIWKHYFRIFHWGNRTSNTHFWVYFSKLYTKFFRRKSMCLQFKHVNGNILWRFYVSDRLCAVFFIWFFEVLFFNMPIFSTRGKPNILKMRYRELNHKNLN